MNEEHDVGWEIFLAIIGTIGVLLAYLLFSMKTPLTMTMGLIIIVFTTALLHLSIDILNRESI